MNTNVINKTKEEKILTEQKEKRNANTKYFLTENHGGIAAVYPYPVHFEEDGEWKEIDNTLQEENTEEAGYQNKASHFKVKFAKHGNSKKLVSVKLEEHKISWGLEPEEKNAAEASLRSVEETGGGETAIFRIYGEKVPSAEEETQESSLASDGDEAIEEPAAGSGDTPLAAQEDTAAWNHRQMQIERARGGGIYENVREGMDLQYILEGERLKENIILKKKEAAAIPIRFRIRHKGLTVEQEGQGSIRFCDSKNPEKEIFRMAAPYLYDRAGGQSGQASYQLETGEKDETVLTIKLDREWLESEERQYPVTVDPGLETSRTVSNIMDTFVREKYPSSSAAGSWGSFVVGNNSSYGKCRAMLKFNTLPAIPEGAVIYDANVCIWQYGFSANNGQSFYVEAHEIKTGEAGEWHSSTATWNKQPEYEAEVLDFAKMENVEAQSVIAPKQFHVTKLIRKWYEGNNYGILLKAQSEDVLADARFVASEYAVGDGTGITSSMFPAGTIYYRDSVGIEDYYSYHEQNVGRAGTVHVNDFNGNLVLVHSDTQFTGNLFPAGLSHVYKLSNRKIDKSLGLGWRLSAYQELLGTGIQDYPYRYIDEDGTSHYFYKDTTDNNKWKDEDGLGFVITQVSSGDTESYRKIETKDKTVLTFRQDGYLSKETDPNGNTITYTYTNIGGKNCLTKITNAAGKTISLQYGTDDRLQYLFDEAGRRFLFTYEDDNLKSITYPDGKTSRYGYDVGSRANVLKYVKAPDEYEMEYDFVSDCGTVRVSHIKEKKGQKTGQEIHITYKDGNMTVFEEPGLDGMLSGLAENTGDASLDNRIYTYQFDSSGRPTCICDQDGNAASYGYFKEGQKNNKLSSQGSTMKPVLNRLMNTRFEDGLNNWQLYGGTSSQIQVVSGNKLGYVGDKSVKVVRTESGSGELGVLQTIQLEEGKTYTVSAYMKADSITAGSDGKLGLIVRALNNAGSWETLAESDGVREKTDAGIDNGWRRDQAVFTVKAGTNYQYLVVIGGFFRAAGTGYMTCFQLEEGNVANPFNMMENGDFEYAASSGSMDPATFTGLLTSSSCADGRVQGTTGKNGNCRYGTHSLHIYGQPGKRKGFWKRILVNGDETDVFSVSGWAKGKAVPGKEFGFTVGFEYTDGTYKWSSIPFNPYISDWQFVNQSISPNDQVSDTAKKYRAIHFHIYYGDNANDVYFDGIQLMRDDGESYVYDDDGNLISAKSAAEKAGFAHDKNGNLSKMSDITGTSFEYGYDTKQNLKRAASSEQLVYQFEYDSKGNPVRTHAYGDKRRGAVLAERLYYIREKVSGKYLTVPNSSTANGTAVQLQPFSKSNNQKWKVVDMEAGYYVLLPMHNTSLALDVYNGNDGDGVKVQIYTRNNRDSQKFKLLSQWRGEYQIAAKCSKDKRVLTNAENTTSAGALITTWGANEAYDRQKWYFEPADWPVISDEPEDGSIFAIRARHSGQYLDVPGGYQTEGLGLQQYYNNGSEGQSFYFQKEEGTSNYSLHPLCAPGMALTRIANDSGINRPAIVLQTYSGTNQAQKFQFVKVGDVYAIYNPQSAEGMGIVGGAENSVGSGARVVTNGGDISTYADNKLFLLENRGKQIASSMTYTADGRQVASVTDARGYTTRNTYDSAGRLLTSVTDARGNKTEYTYEAANDRLKSVSMAVNGQRISNTYTYDNSDRLSSINHNGTVCSYEYDDFGNKAKVKIGDTALESYTYLPNNGPQKTLTYATGETFENAYDNDFRLIYRTLTDSAGKKSILDWNTYDAYDKLLRHEDRVQNITYNYQYDLIGRLTAMDTSKTQKLRLSYDNKNRLEKIVSQIGGSTKTTGYIYGNVSGGEKPGLMYGMRVDNYRRSYLFYDQMSRLKEKRIALGAGKNYYTSYTYVKGQKDWQTLSLIHI